MRRARLLRRNLQTSNFSDPMRLCAAPFPPRGCRRSNVSAPATVRAHSEWPPARGRGRSWMDRRLLLTSTRAARLAALIPAVPFQEASLLTVLERTSLGFLYLPATPLTVSLS